MKNLTDFKTVKYPNNALFNKNKEKALLQADIGKLGSRLYLDSSLRQCYDDSARLYFRRPNESDLTVIHNKNNNRKLGALRKIPSHEMLDYNESFEDVTIEDDIDDEYVRKKPESSYRTIHKLLEPYKNTPLIFNRPKPEQQTASAATVKMPQTIQESGPRFCGGIPKRIVKINRPCSIKVKKSMLKIDDVEITKVSDIKDDTIFENLMQIDIGKEKCAYNTLNPEKNHYDLTKLDGDNIKCSTKPLFKKSFTQNTGNTIKKQHKNEAKNTKSSIPPELYGVLNLYNNNCKISKTLSKSTIDPTISKSSSFSNGNRNNVKSKSHSNSSTNNGERSTIKVFYCKKCKKCSNTPISNCTNSSHNTMFTKMNVSNKDVSHLKKPAKNYSMKRYYLEQLALIRKATIESNLNTNPSLDNFYENLCDSLNKLSS